MEIDDGLVMIPMALFPVQLPNQQMIDFKIIVRTIGIMVLGEGSNKVRSRVPPRRVASPSETLEGAVAVPVPVAVPVYDSTYVPADGGKIAGAAR